MQTQTLSFALGKSKILSMFFIIIMLFLSCMIMNLNMVVWLKFLLILLLLLHFMKHYFYYAKRTSKHSIDTIWRDPSGKWGYQTKTGFRALGELHNNSYHSHWLIIVSIRLKTRCVNIIIPKDAMTYTEYKILSMTLKSI